MSLARPKLRNLDTIVVPDEGGAGRSLVLRDPEGVAPEAVALPHTLIRVVARFDGAQTVAQIAAGASRDALMAGEAPVDTALVLHLAQALDGAFLLESPRFQARRAEVVRAFAELAVRPATHAGGAYHQDPVKLSEYIDRVCLAQARAAPRVGRLVGLCAPHMDLWRAAAGYGQAYRALEQALNDGGATIDTFVVLGTSHALMRRPFAVCDKAFATPLGAMEVDREALRELEADTTFDLHEDAYNHKAEHSIELQIVFLRHLLAERQAKVVPILCGLGEAQARRIDPTRDAHAESFLRALERLVAARQGRVLVVAGADLAHVGPRFGDPRPLDERGRDALKERDHASIDRAITRDERGFFAHVVEDLPLRRVCGVGPMYAMLRAMPREARGHVLDYTQCVDPVEGSIVSHTSLGFYA